MPHPEHASHAAASASRCQEPGSTEGGVAPDEMRRVRDTGSKARPKGCTKVLGIEPRWPWPPACGVTHLAGCARQDWMMPCRQSPSQVMRGIIEAIRRTTLFVLPRGGSAIRGAQVPTSVRMANGSGDAGTAWKWMLRRERGTCTGRSLGRVTNGNLEGSVWPWHNSWAWS